MFKRNLESASQLKVQQANDKRRLPYRQPEVYSLGSLEQVKSYYEGAYIDGSDRAYYYNR